MACAPDGQTVATGAADGTVIVWDLATGTFRRTWQAHAGSVNERAFSPDGVRTTSSSSAGRPADPGGLAGWVDALQAGVSDQAVLAAIFGSAEGYAKWS